MPWRMPWCSVDAPASRGPLIRTRRGERLEMEAIFEPLKMGNRYLEEFFDLREAVPLMARKPRNGTLGQRIEKVAEFAARNGPEFVQLIENKQHHNPDYQFLFGGEGHDYYRYQNAHFAGLEWFVSWVLYCLLAGHSADPSPGGGLKGTSARELLSRVSLPEDVGEAFAQHLDDLDGSKVGKESWRFEFVACVIGFDERLPAVVFEACSGCTGASKADVSLCAAP